MHHTHTTTAPHLNISNALHTFKTGIKKPTLKNYLETLKAGLDLLRTVTSDHSYPVLQDIFNNSQDFNDTISRLEIYFATNIKWKFYRYTKYDKNYIEPFELDFSKHDIRSLLILIRCYNISQGNVSKEVGELIEAYQYIDQYKGSKSLETLKKELPNISTKYIENRYKDQDYTVTESGELAKMIKANLYVLSYDHTGFTQSKKDGRIFNSFTSLNKVYRENELAFQLGEFDISSANPQIIDKIFNTNRWRFVYSNLQKAYGISRDEAKIKFNSTINNYKLSFDQAYQIYINSGYSESEASQLAKLTANSKKGNIYRLMAKKESEIINGFIDANFKDIPCIRLHDAVYYEPEFYDLKEVKYNGVSFSHNAISKEHLRLNLHVNTYKTVLTTPPEPKEGILYKKYFNKHQAKKIYFGDNFIFYDRPFEVLSATFNLNKPIIKNKEYRTPSENEFMARLIRLYITLYYLNEDENIFFKCIEHVHNQDGLSFNKNYIYEYFKSFTFEFQDIKKYIQKRDWNYKGKGILENAKIFNEVYHRERRECVNHQDRPKLIEDIKQMKSSLEQNQLHYIDKNKYHYSHRFESGKIIDEVTKLIGISRVDGIASFNAGVSLILHPILRGNNMVCQISDTPIREIMRTAKTSQLMASKIKAIFTKKTDILMKLETATTNLEAGRTQDIFKDHEPQKFNGLPLLTPKEAFFDDKIIEINGKKQLIKEPGIQLQGSVFDIPREEAIQRDLPYYIQWTYYQKMKYLMWISMDFETGKIHFAKRAITNQYENEKQYLKEIATITHHNHRIKKAV